MIMNTPFKYVSLVTTVKGKFQNS